MFRILMILTGIKVFDGFGFLLDNFYPGIRFRERELTGLNLTVGLTN